MNAEQIEKAIRDRVAEAPDNKYKELEGSDSCAYTVGNCSDGSTGCIFGQILPDGICNRFETVKKIEDDHGEIFYGVTTECISDVLSTGLGIDDEEFLTWCSDMQGCQDSGNHWQEALDNADAGREERKDE